MIKGSVGGQSRNRGKSTRQMRAETIRREKKLQTDRTALIKIRNCLFEDNGNDKDTLAPFSALTTFNKNNLKASIEFTTGAYLDKVEISSLKRVRKHAAPRASFFGTSCFGVEDARFLIVTGHKVEPVVDRDEHSQDENSHPNESAEMKQVETGMENLDVSKKKKNRNEAQENKSDDEDESDCDDDPVIGYVRFFFTLQGELVDQNLGQPCLMIQDLFVEPKMQHCGLGKHLIQLCELMSRSLTLPMMYIVSTRSMEENLRGFLESKLKGYVEDDGSEFLARPLSEMGLPHLIAFVKRF